jgi:hypothetical protein
VRACVPVTINLVLSPFELTRYKQRCFVLAPLSFARALAGSAVTRGYPLYKK